MYVRRQLKGVYMGIKALPHQRKWWRKHELSQKSKLRGQQGKEVKSCGKSISSNLC